MFNLIQANTLESIS